MEKFGSPERIVIEILGILAAVILSISGIPQAYQAYREGHAMGVSLLMILLILVGIVATGGYVYGKHGFDPILHGQYLAQVLIWAVILRYKLKPRLP